MTIADWLTIGIIGGLFASAILADTSKVKKPDSLMLVLGQVGRHVAVLSAIGAYYHFQIEGWGGPVPKGTLIGIIHPEGHMVLYRTLEDAKRLDSTTIEVKAKIEVRS